MKAFKSIIIPQRSGKPREKGLTMLVDKGLGLKAQEDLLNVAGEFIDEAKIITCLSNIIDEEYLKKKLELYKNFQIDVFPGGMHLEIAIKQKKIDEYFEEARRIGYNAVEVSDNIVIIPIREKMRIISIAKEEYGFKVFGEVGRKYTTTSSRGLVSDVQRTLEAGAWKVFLEAMELYQDALKSELIEDIASKVSIENIVFELPISEYPNVTSNSQVEMVATLVNLFGPEVNIANVENGAVLIVEQVRRGTYPSSICFKIGPYEES